MRSHLRLHLPDLNLSVPALCHTSPSSSTSSLPSFSLSLSRSSSKSSSASSVASSSTTAPLTCPPSPITAQILESWYEYDWRNSSDALTDWLNARWKKSGYVVDKRVVYF
ncbi:unnamed protein product [Aureobasidium pullulans]|nr:unnamed protein product [Aureobasidium pullulans]